MDVRAAVAFEPGKPLAVTHVIGGARGRADVPKIVNCYMEKRIEIDRLITHQMPLSDINKAFDLMHEGKSIRSVVTF